MKPKTELTPTTALALSSNQAGSLYPTSNNTPMVQSKLRHQIRGVVEGDFVNQTQCSDTGDLVLFGDATLSVRDQTGALSLRLPLPRSAARQQLFADLPPPVGFHLGQDNVLRQPVNGLAPDESGLFWSTRPLFHEWDLQAGGPAVSLGRTIAWIPLGQELGLLVQVDRTTVFSRKGKSYIAGKSVEHPFPALSAYARGTGTRRVLLLCGLRELGIIQGIGPEVAVGLNEVQVVEMGLPWEAALGHELAIMANDKPGQLPFAILYANSSQLYCTGLVLQPDGASFAPLKLAESKAPACIRSILTDVLTGKIHLIDHERHWLGVDFSSSAGTLDLVELGKLEGEDWPIAVYRESLVSPRGRLEQYCRATSRSQLASMDGAGNILVVSPDYTARFDGALGQFSFAEATGKNLIPVAANSEYIAFLEKGHDLWIMHAATGALQFMVSEAQLIWAVNFSSSGYCWVLSQTDLRAYDPILGLCRATLHNADPMSAIALEDDLLVGADVHAGRINFQSVEYGKPQGIGRGKIYACGNNSAHLDMDRPIHLMVLRPLASISGRKIHHLFIASMNSVAIIKLVNGKPASKPEWRHLPEELTSIHYLPDSPLWLAASPNMVYTLSERPGRNVVHLGLESYACLDPDSETWFHWKAERGFEYPLGTKKWEFLSFGAGGESQAPAPDEVAVWLAGQGPNLKFVGKK